MPTLDELRAGVLAAARTLPGPPGDRQITWVRVLRPRVPALDALDPGDVVVVPPTALAHVAADPIELGALVDALAGAPVAGLILLEPDDRDGPAVAAADGLARSASARGVPAIAAG